MKCSLSLSFLPSRLEGNERATHLVGSRFRDRFGHISINPPPSPCTQPPPPSQPPTTSYERARARDNSRPCLFWWPLFSFFRTHFSFLNYKLEPNFGLRPPLPPSLAAPFLLKSAADGFILRQLLLRLVSFRSATCCSAVQLAVDRNRLA